MSNLVNITEHPNEPILIAGAEGQIIKYGVLVAAGQGFLKAGSVLKENPTTKVFGLINAAPTVADSIYILGTTINTGEVGSTENCIADVYATGIFNRAAIFLGEGIGLDREGEEVLRGKGIYLDCVIPSNGPVPII